MTGVEYADLLGTPWVVGSVDPKDGLDCAGVVGCILVRLGLVGDAAFFQSECDTDEGGHHLFRRVGAGWRDASEEGDIILSRNQYDEPHVSIMVRPKEGFTVTAMKRAGVVVMRAWAIQEITGVYRRVT